MKQLFKFLLSLYQKLISPTLRPSCRFYPSCSQYASEAVDKYGAGSIFMIIKRILRCNPFSAGGYDPVPNIRGK